MATFSAQIVGLDKLKAFFQQFPEKAREAERRVTESLARVAEARLKDRLAGEDVKSRSGALKRSVGSTKAEQDGSGSFIARAGYGALSGPSERYARVQEGIDRSGNEVESTTIRPKGKLLAMPIGAALTAAGVNRNVSDNGHWLKAAYPDGFWISRPGHAPIFVVEKGKGFKHSQLVLLAVGLTSVTIKGKHSLKKSREDALAQMSSIIETETRRAIQAA